MGLPTTRIGGIEISRLVCGSNSFFGFSHISAARDRWIRRVMTDDVIIEIMSRGAELGINAFISGPVERVPKIREEVERRACGDGADHVAQQGGTRAGRGLGGRRCR